MEGLDHEKCLYNVIDAPEKGGKIDGEGTIARRTKIISKSKKALYSRTTPLGLC